ncbi:hypothetical protein GOP47_0012484 [Adiantum capillus-veneris]|uniref:Uncharacterized protein n=1 Tax=Adiantum capillus-veneris TaxID=13818 RepID=A0A9D4US47_ADICA|nr:hypothetical protein GOP47_0012484 [Adiantum capillus-veneris]
MGVEVGWLPPREAKRSPQDKRPLLFTELEELKWRPSALLSSASSHSQPWLLHPFAARIGAVRPKLPDSSTHKARLISLATYLLFWHHPQFWRHLQLHPQLFHHPLLSIAHLHVHLGAT